MNLLNLKPVAAALAAIVVVMFSQSAPAEGDPERGRQLAVTCLGCHGVPGYRNAYPSYRVPKLGGQKPAYIEAALQAYRGRTRPHPTMQAQGATLTDQEITDIAAWVGASGTAKDEVEAEDVAGLEAASACVGCHGTAGANITPAPPILSGQHQQYLEHALRQYKEQARGMTVMNSFAAGLTEEDIEQITAFYASREGLHTLAEDN